MIVVPDSLLNQSKRYGQHYFIPTMTDTFNTRSDYTNTTLRAVADTSERKPSRWYPTPINIVLPSPLFIIRR